MRIPYEMITARAFALESGWGTSRFAVDGNNLFGIRTWNKDATSYGSARYVVRNG